ncbi:MAG: peroxiredoxin [Thaumarchaeota archaeon]|nr:peroxiredoxin [Nitrososphaerota archaeon]
MEVGVGKFAPDFSLTSQFGEVVSLHDYRGKKNVVLYFYAKDFTRACTAEAHSFRENYAAFASTNTEVIGISPDTVESHKTFSNNCGLPFSILSDGDSSVRMRYGVNSPLRALSSRFTGRTTFVIDTSGIIRLIYSSQLQPTKHVSEALRALTDGSLGPIQEKG